MEIQDFLTLMDQALKKDIPAIWQISKSKTRSLFSAQKRFFFNMWCLLSCMQKAIFLPNLFVKMQILKKESSPAEDCVMHEYVWELMSTLYKSLTVSEGQEHQLQADRGKSRLFFSLLLPEGLPAQLTAVPSVALRGSHSHSVQKGILRECHVYVPLKVDGCH